MATIRVTANDIFPTGTLIGAYPAQGRYSLPSDTAPPVAAVATATMADGGALLTGLADSVDYFVGGLVGSVYKYVRVTTRVEVTAGGSSGGSGIGTDASAVGGVNAGTDAGAAATGHAIDLWVSSVDPANKRSGHVWIRTP